MAWLQSFIATAAETETGGIVNWLSTPYLQSEDDKAERPTKEVDDEVRAVTVVYTFTVGSQSDFVSTSASEMRGCVRKDLRVD